MICRLSCCAAIAAALIVPRPGAAQPTARPIPPVTRDSAGIRILEHRALSTHAIGFEQRPWLQLGGLQSDPDQEFDAKNPFLTVAQLSDGRLVASDMSSIKFFDATGKFEKSVGRKGNGPGEFQQLGLLCVTDRDSILTVDYTDRRIHIWDAQGRLARAHASAGLVSPRIPCFADGALLVRLPAPASPGTARHARVRPDGRVLSELGELPVSSPGLVGREVSIVPGATSVLVADPAAFEIRRLAFDGKPVTIVRVTAPLPPLTDAKWREIVTKSLPANLPRAELDAHVARLMAEPHALTLPAFRNVRVDSRNGIWIQHYSAPDTWSVIDSEGAQIGTLTVPVAAGSNRTPELIAVVGRSIVVRDRDADGAWRLSFYRLQ